MTIQQFNNFYAICKKAGFNTLAEVDAFIKGNNFTVSASPICINGVEANDNDIAELLCKMTNGKTLAIARQYKGFTYITTRG
jgi:hypothetical protein